MTQKSETTGSCLCGAVRYALEGLPEQAVVCHCPDCRRAAGAQSVAWIVVPLSRYHLISGEPTEHRSSRGVKRTFCPTCGTTLSWWSERHPDRIDLTIGSLDNPEAFPPTRAVYRRHRLSWASEI